MPCVNGFLQSWAEVWKSQVFSLCDVGQKKCPELNKNWNVFWLSLTFFHGPKDPSERSMDKEEEEEAEGIMTTLSDPNRYLGKKKND